MEEEILENLLPVYFDTEELEALFQSKGALIKSMDFSSFIVDPNVYESSEFVSSILRNLLHCYESPGDLEFPLEEVFPVFEGQGVLSSGETSIGTLLFALSNVTLFRFLLIPSPAYPRRHRFFFYLLSYPQRLECL